MRFVLMMLLIGLFGCQPDNRDKIANLTGYWEIKQVEKNGQVIKSFNINSDIDYFTTNNFSEGSRKKLKPRFDGGFETSKDVLNFRIEILDNDVYLVYSIDSSTLKECVEKATKDQLILSNSMGFKYTYKPYEPLQIN